MFKLKLKKVQSPGKNTRRVMVLGIFYILGLLLFVSAFGLQIVDQKFLQTQGNNRVIRTVEMPAVRGIILDRNEESLAVSTEVYSVWADPYILLDYAEYFPQVAESLEMDEAELNQILRKREKARFVWIKRQLPPHTTNELAKLNLPGIYIEKEYKRFYPDAEITAQLLGFTNSEDKGIEGIELTYDESLKGKVGRKQVIRDTKNRVIDQLKIIEAAEAGDDLMLTIDRRIQLAAYQALKTAIVDNAAKSGAVMVIDAWTGEVLALASQPSGNPNNLHHRVPELMKNRAISDAFEPGSTIKPFVIALGLESRKWTPNSVVSTASGFTVSGNVIRDVARSTSMDLTTVLVKSSNIGVTKVALSMPPEVLWNLYKTLGIGTRTSLGIRGEQSGRLGDVKPWQRNQFEYATKSFGYGISVNVAQLAQMYSVFANDGVLQPITIIKNARTKTQHQPKRVYTKQVNEQLTHMLERVITDNAGSKAKVANYRVAGKSGTARKIENGRYSSTKHRAFFAGFGPVSNPRYVVVVMIDEPTKGQYYGGAIAAPVFSSVMGDTLRILNIKPDGLKELPKIQMISSQ